MKLFAPLLLAAALAAGSSASFAADEPAAAPAPVAAAAPAPAVVAAKPAKPAKPDLVKGEAAYTARACAACHNADGNSAIAANPKLAQQHPEYLLKQLQDFKSGKRKSAIMKPMASALSDDDMRNVAWFLASKKIKPGFAKDKATVALGEQIYRGGISDRRQIAACAGCHSPNGAGTPSQYPRLGGQSAEYTSAQLVQFRDGERLNSVPMHDIAAMLNDREIKAVADYIAGLR